MCQSDLWVDNTAHELHLSGHTFSCDRDIEAMALWKGCALLLSSDTDCLSLWDTEGLVRTARVGVYPQDMAVQADIACICGGADGKLHLLSLPDLQPLADISLPGMPERITLREESAYVLSLQTDLEVCTALLKVCLQTGLHKELTRFPGLPGAVLAVEDGLWVGVSELVCHIPAGADCPDTMIEGFGLARRIAETADGVLVDDPLEGRMIRIPNLKERPSRDERP